MVEIPLSVHIEDDSLITSGFNNRPKGILSELRYLTQRCNSTGGVVQVGLDSEAAHALMSFFSLNRHVAIITWNAAKGVFCGP